MVEVSGDGIEDTHFMVMAGMGFDAAIMEGVNEEIKTKVGWLAYVLSGAARSLMFPAVRVEVSVDGGEFTTHRARTIVVGNVGFLQAGMPLLPDAAIDDGVLDVVLLHPQRFLSWIPLAVRVLCPSTTHRRADQPDDRPSVVVRAPAPTPPASSTATRSAPGASCAWSASTAGCSCGSRADEAHARRPLVEEVAQQPVSKPGSDPSRVSRQAPGRLPQPARSRRRSTDRELARAGPRPGGSSTVEHPFNQTLRWPNG